MSADGSKFSVVVVLLLMVVAASTLREKSLPKALYLNTRRILDDLRNKSQMKATNKHKSSSALSAKFFIFLQKLVSASKLSVADKA